MSLLIRELTESDTVDAFDCGKDEDELFETLNGYLKTKAKQARRANGTVTWVAVIDDMIVGYYSCVFASLKQEELPGSAARAVRPYPVPCFLIARLAVDHRFKKQGIGAKLLLHALKNAVAASKIAGLRLVILDALKPEVMDFYSRFGFKKYSELGMLTKISDVEKTLSA